MVSISNSAYCECDTFFIDNVVCLSICLQMSVTFVHPDEAIRQLISMIFSSTVAEYNSGNGRHYRFNSFWVSRLQHLVERK